MPRLHCAPRAPTFGIFWKPGTANGQPPASRGARGQGRHPFPGRRPAAAEGAADLRVVVGRE
eukprot:1654555-Lingulodinium_polyedra.AAC.1